MTNRYYNESFTASIGQLAQSFGPRAGEQTGQR